MATKLTSLLLVALVLTMSGCKANNTSSVADVPAGSGSGPITAQPDPGLAGPQPVALKGGTGTATHASYNSTDTFTLSAPGAGAAVGPAVPTTPATVAGGNYVVRQGDTLWSISRAHYGSGQRWKEIVAANPGLSPERMPVGKAIVLP